jgi:hypothetical protein
MRRSPRDKKSEGVSIPLFSFSRAAPKPGLKNVDAFIRYRFSVMSLQCGSPPNPKVVSSAPTRDRMVQQDRLVRSPLTFNFCSVPRVHGSIGNSHVRACSASPVRGLSDGTLLYLRGR